MLEVRGVLTCWRPWFVVWRVRRRAAAHDGVTCCAAQVDYITFEKPEKISVPGHDRKVDFGMMWDWAYKVEGSDEEVRLTP